MQKDITRIRANVQVAYALSLDLFLNPIGIRTHNSNILTMVNVLKFAMNYKFVILYGEWAGRMNFGV